MMSRQALPDAHTAFLTPYALTVGTTDDYDPNKKIPYGANLDKTQPCFTLNFKYDNDDDYTKT